MSEPVIRGNQLVQEPTIYTWKTGTGGQTIEKFSGTSTLILSKKTELENQGWATEVTEGPVWKLTATLNIDLSDNPTNTQGNNQEEPEPNWELIPNQYMASMYESGMFPQIPTKVKEGIEFKIKNPDSAKSPMFKVDPKDITPTVITTADRIYALRGRGIECKPMFYLTLKRSMIVNGKFENLSWDNNNANVVLSTSKVQSLYNVPRVLRKLMPPSKMTVDYVEGTLTQLPLYFYQGWLENHPSYQYVGADKIQISQEWTYNQWSVTQPNQQNGLYEYLE